MRDALLLAEKALGRLEFSDHEDDCPMCPLCGGVDPNDPELDSIEEDGVGHSENCDAGRAVVAVKEALFGH